MSEMTFHLPTAGYESLAQMIPGYLHAGADAKPVSASAVAGRIAIGRPNISANNKFFLSTGILERVGRAYVLTTDGAELARVLDFHVGYTGQGDAPDPVRAAWQTIVERNDFLNSVTTAVRVRGSMESEAFARHIALTSGAPNKPRFLTGARTVIVILKTARKLAEDEDGVLKVVDTDQDDRDAAPELLAEERREEPIHPPHEPQKDALEPKISLTVMVQITPTTTDDELAELAQKIKRLAHLISTDEEPQEGDVRIS